MQSHGARILPSTHIYLSIYYVFKIYIEPDAVILYGPPLLMMLSFKKGMDTMVGWSLAFFILYLPDSSWRRR